MRRWLADARDAALVVSERPGLWVAGALAWCLTVGWIPLLVAVARPPSVTDLTFVGTRMFGSSAWPWNAIAVGAGAVLLVAIATFLVVVAEAALVARSAGRPAPGPAAIVGLVAVTIVTATPALVAILATGIGFVLVALREFNAPGEGDPVLRTFGRLAIFLSAFVVSWMLGSTAHAAASRSLLLGRAGVVGALAGVFPSLAARPLTILVQALAVVLFRVAYLAVATMLLVVLWAPIGARLGGGGIDAALLPLLVGFVAIWLCLVLGGGALHAWGSVSWTRVLVPRARGIGQVEPYTHGGPIRP